MPSFDVVSQVDMQEVRNALDQASREIANRFDFKGTDSSIDLSGTEITLHSNTEQKLKALVQVMEEKFVRRNVPLKALAYGKLQEAAKGTARQVVTLNVGISDEQAWAWAGLTSMGIFLAPASIFSRARARGSPVPRRSAPLRSASNSRERDSAICRSMAATGARRAKAIWPKGLLRRSRPPPPPNMAPHIAMRATNVMAMAMAAATEPMRMSRLPTW